MLNRKELRSHERRILDGLISFYYEDGYKSNQYRDTNTGGIYENKLAMRLGYELEGEQPPPVFLEAVSLLESQNFVRRLIRTPASSVMGVWPTPMGLDHHEFIHKPWYIKIIIKSFQKWDTILVSIITTLVTITLKSCFGGKP